MAMAAVDRDPLYRRYFRDKQKEYLRTLVSDELIEEYRRNSFGQHSESLERLLMYFREADGARRYVVRRDSKTGTFRIGRLTGKRDQPLELIDDTEYATAEDAIHNVFLHRLHQLLGSSQ